MGAPGSLRSAGSDGSDSWEEKLLRVQQLLLLPVDMDLSKFLSSVILDGRDGTRCCSANLLCLQIPPLLLRVLLLLQDLQEEAAATLDVAMLPLLQRFLLGPT